MDALFEFQLLRMRVERFKYVWSTFPNKNSINQDRVTTIDFLLTSITDVLDTRDTSLDALMFLTYLLTSLQRMFDNLYN
jgi:hypothetical protein